MEMEFGQGRHIVSDRGSQKLLPECGIVLPTRPQLVTMACRDALDFSWAEGADDTDHTGCEPQHLGGNARVRACRVPCQSQRLGTQFARRLFGKDAGDRALCIGGINAVPNLTPPLLILESHVDEKKWALGCSTPCGLIQLKPEPLAGRHPLQRAALGKCAALCSDLLPKHVQAALVQCVDEVKRFSAGPFPSWQGSGRVHCIGGHAVIVCGKTPALPSSLGVFFPKTK